MTDDVELRRLAIRRADMKLAFRSHLLAYVMVNAGLVAIYIALRITRKPSPVILEGERVSPGPTIPEIELTKR